MLAPIVALVSLVAPQASQPTSFSPIPGSSSAFQSTIRRVIDASQQGDFKKAKALAAQLPRKEFVITLNDGNLTPGRRETFRRAFQLAADAWTRLVPSLKITFGSGKDIVVSYADSLPVDEETKLPRGLALFIGEDASEPRVEGVIALNRMSPPVAVEFPGIRQEALFLIGSFLGLERGIRPNSAMGRSDGLGAAASSPAPIEANLARRNIELAERLTRAVESKQKLSWAAPEVFIDAVTVDLGTVPQGPIAQASFSVANRGSGDLSFTLVPDCSCFAFDFNNVVKPDTANNVSVYMNTMDFPGPINKQVLVYTNDPENPVRLLRFTGMVMPAYRFVEQGGFPGVVYLSETGGQMSLILTIDPANPFKIKTATVNGPSAVAAFEPWEGVMAPSPGASPVPQRGYKIDILVAPGIASGRVSSTLLIETDHPSFKTLLHPFLVQKGISANPTTLFLGEISSKPLRAFVILSQPGKPFQVQRVTSDSPTIKPSFERLPNGDYKIVAELDGTQLAGTFRANLVVTLSGADEKEMIIPVQASVR
ncbi:MAG: DUF1573 domain-containing protein [Fimbriimonadaceae bacterium]|jgi:hypothetical protein|nr:DUF1573 domain-containing protein [Fimbriimonadaceae bacterium]